MSTRSLNKAMLIGNLTKDPELRYTPSGTAVCSFRVATNRSWTPADSNERREETEFHRIVTWNKLAELCSQLLTKGRKVYIEGRLQTRSWDTPEGEKRFATEVVAEDMVLLDSRRMLEEKGEEAEREETPVVSQSKPGAEEPTKKEDGQEKDSKKASKQKEKPKETKDDSSKEAKKEAKEEEGEIDVDDIPF
jgi:single-strand DNA-binding protein